MQYGKNLVALILAALILLAAQPGLADSKTDKMADLFESSIAQESSGNIDRALSETLAVLKLDSKHYLGNFRAAWLYYYKGNYQKSITYYKKATALNADSIEAKLGLLLPLMATKKWGEAETLGEKLYAMAPYNYYAGSRLAYIYYAQEKYAEAAVQYKKVIKAFPSETDMMLGLGWTYLKLGKKQDAKNAFTQVLIVNKDNLSAKTGLESL